MKVLIAEKISDKAIEYLKEQGLRVDVRLHLNSNELKEIIGEYDALIVRSVTKIDASLLEKSKNLKIVGRGGVGTDNIDIPSCTKKGIMVTNTPRANTVAAAELAVALTLCLFRNLQEVQDAVRRGDFRRSLMVGHEVEGKTAAVIGFGHIGSTVARKLRGIGMEVIGYDPHISKKRFATLGFKYEETFNELIQKADLITFHTPKLPETIDMLNKDNINLCKQGAYIVNASRGGIVNEEALYEALKSGRIRGAALDVFTINPNYTKAPSEQTFTHPLLTLKNCIVTPHLGASTEEASLKVGEDISKVIVDALQGKQVNILNKEALQNTLCSLSQ